MIRTLFPLPQEHAPTAPTEATVLNLIWSITVNLSFVNGFFRQKRTVFFVYFSKEIKIPQKFFRKNFPFFLLTKNINAHIMGAEFHNRKIQVSFLNESNGNRVRIPDGPATV